MLFLIWIRDLGYVPGGIFGTAPLVPQQQFFDILMIDSGFFGNRKRVYRLFQSFIGYKPEHSNFSIIPRVRACFAGT